MNDLRRVVARGLPKRSLGTVASYVAADPREAARLKAKLVPPATYKRRTTLLKPEESEKLERLAREQRNQQMAESARRLQEAAKEMRRAASQQGHGSASGSAAEQLENARRLLEESRQSSQAGGIEDAARRAQALAEQQREVARDVQGLPTAVGARTDREQRLDERKVEMAGEVQQLQEDVERMGRDLARERPEAARDLREAARGMREGRLRDKIQFSRGVMRQGAADYVRNWEQSITDDLDSLSARLDRGHLAGNQQRARRPPAPVRSHAG